ncbi:MAG: sulfatase-like hydrolase/transferase, partial [Pseudomonadota bacterium]
KFFKYDQYFDETGIRRAKAAYYGLITFMDACVGRVLKALSDSGQANDTVVIYTSDHGDMMGDQGFWTKQVMYEASAGVPMIAAGPGLPAGRRVLTGTSLLDLSATALDVLQVSPETGAEPGSDVDARRKLPGRSLRDIAQAPDDPDRTVLSEYHDGGSTTGTFMVRWQNWKYVHYVGERPQLFDIAADPLELSDLAADPVAGPEVLAAIAEGESRLRAICDPDAVNARCFADQGRRIEALGGEEACRNAYVFNHTPTPSEQEKLREGGAL